MPQPLRQALLALLAGAGAVPAFGLPDSLAAAVPQGLTFLLPLLSIGWLFRQLDRAEKGTAQRLAYTWSLGFFFAGVSWVYVSLARFSGLPMPAAALATLAFCAFLALYPTLACAAFVRLRQPDAAGKNALLFAALWALSEWLRGTLFTGFPWLALGYAQMPPSPLAGYASTLGVYGVSMVAVLLPALLAGRARRTWLSALLIVGTGQLLSAMTWTTPIGEPVHVRLLQGNVPQDVKWVPGQLERSVDTYLGLLNSTAKFTPATTATVLNVLPETAIPLLYDQIPRELLTALSAHGDTLLGVAVRTSDGGYANAAIGLRQNSIDKPEGLYAKQHLVPFGEYSPPGFGWFFRLLRIPMADFTAGPALQTPIPLADQRIAPNICYEDLFGAELLPALREATLLINLSNTAWFGDSLAQPQHLQIARMRALETGRTMLRATNSGMTAMILPDGQVAAKLPAFTTALLTVEARGYTGLTPYAKWGNALIVLLTSGIVLLAWRRRQAHQGKAA